MYRSNWYHSIEFYNNDLKKRTDLVMIILCVQD